MATIEIETLSHQRSIANEHQQIGFDELEPRCERSDDARCLSRLHPHQLARLLGSSTEIEKPAIFSQLPRPRDAKLFASGVGLEDLLRSASRCGDPIDGFPLHGGVENYIGLPPAPGNPIPLETSQIGTEESSGSSSRCSLPDPKKANDRPLGDQMIELAPSLPDSG